MSFKFRILLAFVFMTSPLAMATKILVFGDFGTNDNNQKIVAEHMKKFCKEKGCDFAITTGDNIYPNGVDNIPNSPKPIPNYQLIVDKFVKHYENLQIPIYMSFGNHDVGNEGVISTFKNFFSNSEEINRKTEILMKNQLSFSNSHLNPQLGDEEKTRLWVFPNAYYALDPTNDKKTRIAAIDTNSFPHQAFKEGTFDIDSANPNNMRQKTWLDEDAFLGVSPKTWKIVFGHQPLLSHGIHGVKDKKDLENFKNSIFDTLCDSNVDFYLSGHDHHLEIDKLRCDGKDHVVNFILTGAAAKETEIKLATFPFFGQDPNLVWANGITYKGSTTEFAGNTKALGFTYIDINHETNTAKVHMLLTTKDRDAQQSVSCFLVKRGQAIEPLKTCD